MKITTRKTIGNITEEIIERICFDELKKWNTSDAEGSELLDILTDIEFWEGGSVEIEDDGMVWLSGDNGRQEVHIETILGITWGLKF